MFGTAVRFRKESEDVYLTLIADLASTAVPTCIMGLTLLAVDWFAWTTTGEAFFLAAAIAGGLGSIAKLALMFIQKRTHSRHELRMRDAARWEASHAIATAVVAASVGAVLAGAFFRPDADLQILATALLFGYCSGVVSRLAIRPKIAILALVLAGAPAIFAATFANTAAHSILAVMFSVFLVGAVDTVRHLYHSAIRHITSRLEMARLARNDPLTGLANRLGLREAYRAASHLRGSLAVHCLDLDGFKSVNDKFGHAVGDAVLTNVAQRLLGLAPPSATVARFGGDEFVILQPGISQSLEAEFLAAEIVNVLSQPFVIESETIEIGASLGLSVASTNSDFDELLRRADEASYLVKRNGGGVAVASEKHFAPIPERARSW